MRLKQNVRYVLYGLLVFAGVIGLLAARARLLPQAEPAAAAPVVKQAPAVTKASVKEALLRDWRKILAAHPDVPVSIAVYAKQYDTTVSLNSDQTTPHLTASIVKVAMLTQVLHNHAQAGTKLTASEQAAAVGAIEHSNNVDATALYHVAGSGAGLTNLFANLKMSDSRAYASGWVATTTTASDQLKLLNQIFYDGDYLTANAKAYIKELMGSVEDAQQWGISAGSKHFQLKNGWRYANSRWIVNSIGHLGQGDKSCTIAILTANHKTLKAGINVVERLAKVTGDDLDLQ